MHRKVSLSIGFFFEIALPHMLLFYDSPDIHEFSQKGKIILTLLLYALIAITMKFKDLHFIIKFSICGEKFIT